MAENTNAKKRTLHAVILTLACLMGSGFLPVMAEGDDGDPDAIGHSADGFYLDFSPVGKVELPRIFLIRDAAGEYRIETFSSTNVALESGEFGLLSGPEADAEMLADAVTDGIVEEHAHVYYPVASKTEGDTIIVDLSITRQMVFVLLCGLILLWLGLSTASRYKKGVGRDTAPRGRFQNAMEAIILFIRDDVAIPTIGKEKHAKYLPFLLSVFIFILLGNLIGLLPWGVTATSGISVTGALAAVTFVITNISGNKDYWKHIFNPPGIPALIKPVIVPVEFLGLFTKPITLAIRLFANMLSGHLVIVSLLGLIFIFTAQAGTAAGIGSIFIAVPMTIFIYLLKILVSLIQAYIFTMLSALYIGLATEEHAHDDHHEAEAHEPALAGA